MTGSVKIPLVVDPVSLTLREMSADEQIPHGQLDYLSHMATFAKDPTTTTGLTWGYLGGRWGGFAVVAGTLVLTANSTLYITVSRSTGAVSVSDANTAWNNESGYARIYKLTTGAATVTAVEDWRAGGAGIFGQAASGSGGSVFTDQNQTFTAAQRGAIVALADGATITPDMNASNFFSVTLAGNRTLGNPTNITPGQSGSIFITQDGTGSRTLAYGSYWDFAGGAAPSLSTAANSVDRLDYLVRTATSIHAVLTKAWS